LRLLREKQAKRGVVVPPELREKTKPIPAPEVSADEDETPIARRLRELRERKAQEEAAGLSEPPTAKQGPAPDEDETPIARRLRELRERKAQEEAEAKAQQEPSPKTKPDRKEPELPPAGSVEETPIMKRLRELRERKAKEAALEAEAQERSTTESMPVEPVLQWGDLDEARMEEDTDSGPAFEFLMGEELSEDHSSEVLDEGNTGLDFLFPELEASEETFEMPETNLIFDFEPVGEELQSEENLPFELEPLSEGQIEPVIILEEQPEDGHDEEPQVQDEVPEVNIEAEAEDSIDFSEVLNREPLPEMEPEGLEEAPIAEKEEIALAEDGLESTVEPIQRVDEGVLDAAEMVVEETAKEEIQVDEAEVPEPIAPKIPEAKAETIAPKMQEPLPPIVETPKTTVSQDGPWVETITISGVPKPQIEKEKIDKTSEKSWFGRFIGRIFGGNSGNSQLEKEAETPIERRLRELREKKERESRNADK
jgi:hypothetical protein